MKHDFCGSLLGLGPARYIGLVGVSGFGGWMFISSCFSDKFNGRDLTFESLTVWLILSLTGGAVWGWFMWKIMVSKSKSGSEV